MKTVIAKDVFGNTYEVEAAKLVPSVHVYGIAVQDGKALISPQFDGYDWPGGTFELGESTEETLKREFKEETGYEVRPRKLIGIYTSFFHHHKRNIDYQSFLVFYLVEIVGGEISTDGFDVDEREYAEKARWMTLDALETMRHACSIDIAAELLAQARQANGERE